MEPLNPKWRRGFWSLIATQFQGALNENGLKNLVIYLILSLDINEARRQGLVLVVGALFVVPFFLFSMLGGYFADRFSKRLVTIGTKYFELAVMLFAAAALAWSNMNLAMAAVFLASTQAAIFGPSKYGLLPELSPGDRLSWANGVLELGTFVAIIAGTVTGATMADVFHGRQGISGLIFAAFSLIGLACSYAIIASRLQIRQNNFARISLASCGAKLSESAMTASSRSLSSATLTSGYSLHYFSRPLFFTGTTSFMSATLAVESSKQLLRLASALEVWLLEFFPTGRLKLASFLSARSE